MQKNTVKLAIHLQVLAFFGLTLATPVLATESAKQEWVGYWQQGEKHIVITAPEDGAADAINVQVYPDGVQPQVDTGKTKIVSLQAYDTDLEHPKDMDGSEGGDYKIIMQLSGQELRVEQEKAADEETANLSGIYRKDSSPLAMLLAEKPAWVSFHCDCDGEKIKQSLLPQLASGYAAGKDDIEQKIERVVMETLDAKSPTVLVLTHSSDSECSQDSFRIATKGVGGQWRGDVAHWLGLPRKPGGIKDEELWQLSKAEQQVLDSFEEDDVSVIPRFWWDHATKTLKVGMETCIVLPENAGDKIIKKAKQLETFAANFKPKVYHLKPTVN